MLNLTEEQMQRLQKAVAEQAEEKAKEAVTRLDKTLDIAVDKLVKKGWTLPAELNLPAINALGNKNALDDVDAFMQMVYSCDEYKNIKNMIKGIRESHVREPLRKIVEECWIAFQNETYIICANSLLVVIEGILSEFWDDKNNTRMMQVCQKQVDDFPEEGSTLKKHVWISYNTFIRDLYEFSKFDSEEPTKIKRHWFIHGRSEYDVNEVDCIKLFNAVHSIAMIVDIEYKNKSN